MVNKKINMPSDEAVKKPFSELPEAEYVAEIMDYKEKITKNGDPMYMITLEIILGDKKGRLIFDSLIFSDNKESPAYSMLWRTKFFLKCIKEPSEGAIEYNPENWLGRRVRVETKNQKYTKDGVEKIAPKVFKYILDDTLNTEENMNKLVSKQETWDEESPL